MNDKQYSSAKIQAEEYCKKVRKNRQRFFCEYAKFLLTLPFPMSYEVWSGLHKKIEELEK